MNTLVECPHCLAEIPQESPTRADLVDTLRTLVSDPWTGWGDDGYSNWLCFWCGARGEQGDDFNYPKHKPTCPVVRGRQLLEQEDTP